MLEAGYPVFDPILNLIPASINVLVPNCKIYNDASCDISADGQLLAVFIPSSQRGFPDEGILAIYSLAPHNLGEMLYTKRFGTACAMACQSFEAGKVGYHRPIKALKIDVVTRSLPARRPERHLRQLVSDGLLRHGGTGLSQDPAPSHHRPHGGASLPPAAASRWRDVHQGEWAGPSGRLSMIQLLASWK